MVIPVADIQKDKRYSNIPVVGLCAGSNRCSSLRLLTSFTKHDNLIPSINQPSPKKPNVRKYNKAHTYLSRYMWCKPVKPINGRYIMVSLSCLLSSTTDDASSTRHRVLKQCLLVSFMFIMELNDIERLVQSRLNPQSSKASHTADLFWTNIGKQSSSRFFTTFWTMKKKSS